MEKIASIGLITMMLCTMLGKGKNEYSIALAIFGSLVIFGFGMDKMKTVVTVLGEVKQAIGISEAYIIILLKMIGIAYIAEFSSSLCRDAGQSAIAGQIDFVGKVSMIVISLPVLRSLLSTMSKLLPMGGGS